MYNIGIKVWNMSKSGYINRREYNVKYPKKEKAYVLIPHNGIPFESAVIGITYPSADYEIKREKNSRICVFEYVVSGEGEIYLHGKWHTVTAGDFYILPSGVSHHYRASAACPWEKIWINYVSGYMGSLLSSYGVEGGVYRAEDIKQSFDRLTDLAKESALTDGTAFEIADKLHCIVKSAALQTALDAEQDVGMRKTLASYVYKKFSLDLMAEQLIMSKSNLIRVYKKIYGTTPYNDLINMKIEAAKKLLEETSLPIKDIAERLCVYDEHYFSALFLEKTGKRPGGYRKNQEKNYSRDTHI